MQGKNIRKSLPIILIIFIVNYSNASSDATKGWFYYEKQPLIESSQINNFTFNSYKELLDKAKKEYEEIEAAAIINPSQENIKAYREAMQLVSDRSSKLAMLTTTQNWQDPNSRISQEAVNGSGLQQDLEKARIENAEIIKNYGIFYFFTKDCKYCYIEANELKRLETTYGINIIAISMDDSKLPQFPKALKDNGFSDRLGINKAGALVAFDVKNNKPIIVGYGYLHYDEIMKRIHALFISGTAYPEEYVHTKNPVRISK